MSEPLISIRNLCVDYITESGDVRACNNVSSGGWMDRVKTLFGFILLAAPIFLLERIMPEMWSTILWSTLGIAAFGWQKASHIDGVFQQVGVFFSECRNTLQSI